MKLLFLKREKAFVSSKKGFNSALIEKIKYIGRAFVVLING